MNKGLAVSGLLIILIISVVLASYIPDLRFNYVFEDFFPSDDPELAQYEKFKENFEEDNNYILIGLSNYPSVFDSAFLNNTSKLIKKVESLDPTEDVNSLLDASIPIIAPTGLLNLPILHSNDPNRYSDDSIRIYKSSWIPSTWISQDATSIVLFTNHHNLTDKTEADAYIDNIKDAIQDAGFTNYNMAGKLYAQQVYVNKMQEELVTFLGLSVILVVIFLILIYRSFWAVIVPLVVVGLSIIWLAGFMALTGKTIDLLMVLMPTILFVVGMSDVVHILSRYLEELRKGKEKIIALKITIKEIGLATFLTSLTTSIGFITLLTASIKPVREFGVYIAIGVFFAYIIAFTLLPSILFFIREPKITGHIHLKHQWNRYLGGVFIWILHNKKTALGISAGLIILSVMGISQIKINTYLIEDLPEGDPLKENFMFFDKKFGGSRPFEATVMLSDTSLLISDRSVINEMAKVENIISTALPTNFLISPVFIVKMLNQAIHGGNSDFFTLPKQENEWQRISSYYKRMQKRPEVEQLISANGQQARITGRMDDIGSSITLEKRKEIIEQIATQVDSTIVNVQITGSSFLIDKNNEYLVKNMLSGLTIAFVVVALIAGLMFFEWRMIIITLLPNILPLLVTAAVMGFFDISLKLSTSMVFTIAFGIAVDDTIHLLSKLRMEISKGKSLIYALKRAYLSTGKAITLTTIILSGGFLILLFSSFGGTFYTGLLVGLTLILALLIDLILLPVLIVIFYPKYKTQTV